MISSRPSVCPRYLAFSFLALAAPVSLISPVHAATDTWTAGGGSGSTGWSNSSNWSGGSVPAFASGDVFDLSTLNITSNSTSTVDASATVGVIKIGDATTSSHTWTLAPGSGITLTLDNGGSNAQINQTSTSFGDTISVPLAVKGSLDIANASASKTLTISGGISSSATSGTQTVTNLGSAAGAVTISGIIKDGLTGGKVGVTQNGTGTLTLSGVNTYTGTTLVQSGTLIVANASALGSGTSDILLGDTGGNKSAGITLNNVSLSRNITVQAGNSGTMTLDNGSGASAGAYTGIITLGSGGQGHSLTLNYGPGTPSGTSVGFLGKIVDPAGLTGTAGVVTINESFNFPSFGNANSTYSGGTILNDTHASNSNSFLNFVSGNIFGTGTVTINSLVVREAANNTITGTNKQIWNGDWSTVDNGSNGTLNWNMTGTIDLGNTGTSTVRTLTINQNTSIAGIIQNGSNSFTNALAKAGTNTLTLTGTNTYTGGTTVTGGTLKINNASGLGASTGSLTVNNINTGAATAVVVNLYGSGATTTGSLSGSIATASSGTNTATINLGASQNYTVNQTASGTYAGVLAGAGSSLTLGSLSTATLSLTGANTYTGGTTVQAGKLLVNNTSGSGTGTGSLTVNSGATFGGTGTANTASFNIGGAVQVGNGIDTTSALTLKGAAASTFTGANLAFNLDKTTAGVGNSLNVGTTGILFTNTTLTLNLVNSNPTINNSIYTLISGTGSSQYSGFTTFTNANGQQQIVSGGGLNFLLVDPVDNSPLGGSYLFLSGSNINIELMAVPEPGTWAMMLGGFVLLVIVQRKRCRLN